MILQWLFGIGITLIVIACVGFLIAQQAAAVIRRQL